VKYIYVQKHSENQTENPCIESATSRQIRIRMQREMSLLMIIFRRMSGTQFKSKLNFL